MKGKGFGEQPGMAEEAFAGKNKRRKKFEGKPQKGKKGKKEFSGEDAEVFSGPKDFGAKASQHESSESDSKVDKIIEDHIFSKKFLSKYYERGGKDEKIRDEKDKKIEDYADELHKILPGKLGEENFVLDEFMLQFFSERDPEMRDAFEAACKGHPEADEKDSAEKGGSKKSTENIQEIKEEFPLKVTFRHRKIEDSLAFISKYFKGSESGEQMAGIIFEFWNGKKTRKIRKNEEIKASELADRLKDYEADKDELEKREAASALKGNRKFSKRTRRPKDYSNSNGAEEQPKTAEAKPETMESEDSESVIYNVGFQGIYQPLVVEWSRKNNKRSDEINGEAVNELRKKAWDIFVKQFPDEAKKYKGYAEDESTESEGKAEEASAAKEGGKNEEGSEEKKDKENENKIEIERIQKEIQKEWEDMKKIDWKSQRYSEEEAARYMAIASRASARKMFRKSDFFKDLSDEDRVPIIEDLLNKLEK